MTACVIIVHSDFARRNDTLGEIIRAGIESGEIVTIDKVMPFESPDIMTMETSRYVDLPAPVSIDKPTKNYHQFTGKSPWGRRKKR